MTTIFLKVLTELIKKQLGPLSNSLQNKSHGWLTNDKLSLAQKSLVDKLSDSIVRFNGAEDDEKNKIAILSLIENAHKTLRATRVKHGVPADDGQTIKIFSLLLTHTKDFYDKLSGMDFKLLNRIYCETPQFLVYSHAVYYFGEEVFNPTSSNLALRQEKETHLQQRLDFMSRLITIESTLDEQKKLAARCIDDLFSDNEKAIKNANPKIDLPSITIATFISTDVLKKYGGYGLGRMETQFTQCLNEINELTEATFNKSPEEIDELNIARHSNELNARAAAEARAADAQAVADAKAAANVQAVAVAKVAANTQAVAVAKATANAKAVANIKAIAAAQEPIDAVEDQIVAHPVNPEPENRDSVEEEEESERLTM